MRRLVLVIGSVLGAASATAMSGVAAADASPSPTPSVSSPAGSLGSPSPSLLSSPGPNASGPIPSTSAGTTAFTLSGAIDGPVSITSTICARGSGQDQPMALDFTGTVGGVVYVLDIGGYEVVSGTVDLLPGAPVGLTLQHDPNDSLTRMFWAAPLRTTDGGAGGTMTIAVTDLGSSGSVEADLVQEIRGMALPDSTIVHVAGAWDCPFSG